MADSVGSVDGGWPEGEERMRVVQEKFREVVGSSSSGGGGGLGLGGGGLGLGDDDS